MIKNNVVVMLIFCMSAIAPNALCASGGDGAVALAMEFSKSYAESKERLSKAAAVISKEDTDVQRYLAAHLCEDLESKEPQVQKTALKFFSDLTFVWEANKQIKGFSDQVSLALTLAQMKEFLLGFDEENLKRALKVAQKSADKDNRASARALDVETLKAILSAAKKGSQ